MTKTQISKARFLFFFQKRKKKRMSHTCRNWDKLYIYIGEKDASKKHWAEKQTGGKVKGRWVWVGIEGTDGVEKVVELEMS